jgi:hypothetical protein
VRPKSHRTGTHDLAPSADPGLVWLRMRQVLGFLTRQERTDIGVRIFGRSILGVPMRVILIGLVPPCVLAQPTAAGEPWGDLPRLIGCILGILGGGETGERVGSSRRGALVLSVSDAALCAGRSEAP